MEKVLSDVVDNEVNADGLLVGSLSARSTKSSPMRTKCLCKIESSVIISRMKENLGRRFIGCCKYKVQKTKLWTRD
jgi:hypothetical protein